MSLLVVTSHDSSCYFMQLFEYIRGHERLCFNASNVLLINVFHGTCTAAFWLRDRCDDESNLNWILQYPLEFI